jgi:DNA-binding IclR family transcriptional regulator
VRDRVVALPHAVETTLMRSSELARRVGLSASTAHRLVGAMVVHALLRVMPRGGIGWASGFRRHR